MSEPSSPEKVQVTKEYSTTIVPGKSPNIAKFPAPTFTSTWVADDMVAIGAGGGKKFGMANMVQILRSTRTESMKWQSECAQSCENVVWCTSKFHDESLLVTHPSSLSFLRYNKKNGDLKVVSRCEIQRSHAKEPNKKPVAYIAPLKYAVARDDNTLALVTVDGKTGQVSVAEEGTAVTGEIEDIDSCLELSLLATTVSSGVLCLWDAKASPLRIVFTYKQRPGEFANAKKVRWAFVRFNTKGTKLYAVLTSVSVGSMVCCFNVDVAKDKTKGRTTPTLTLEMKRIVSKDIVTCISLDADRDRWIACGTNEGDIFCIMQVALVDLGKLRQVHDSPVTSISISPKGEMVVSTDVSHLVVFTTRNALQNKLWGNTVFFLLIVFAFYLYLCYK